MDNRKRLALRGQEHEMSPPFLADRRKELEEVHTFDPKKEAVVTHDQIRVMVDLIENDRGPGRAANVLRKLLPKPRPTLREELRRWWSWADDRSVNAIGMACGIDPDKRVEDPT